MVPSTKANEGAGLSSLEGQGGPPAVASGRYRITTLPPDIHMVLLVQWLMEFR